MRTRYALALLLFPSSVFAWGNTGHEAVAAVAWKLMTPAAKTRAIALIRQVPTLVSPRSKTVPGFAEWMDDLPSGLSTDSQNLFLFMRAATWPDTIKHVGFTDSDSPPKGVNPTKDGNIGFKDTQSHGYFHFVDAAFASDNSQSPATPSPNAATQIAAFRTAIASTEPDLLKAYHMIWLEHLVGDVHQPLHGTTRIFAKGSDLGGNSVRIRMPAAMKQLFEGTLSNSAPSELHAFWDDLPGEGEPAPALPQAEAFANGLTAASGNAVNDTNPAHWATESFDMAKSDAYRSPIGDGPKPTTGSSYEMTQAYYDAALKDAKERIALAGARLAKLLNDNLK